MTKAWPVGYGKPHWQNSRAGYCMGYIPDLHNISQDACNSAFSVARGISENIESSLNKEFSTKPGGLETHINALWEATEHTTACGMQIFKDSQGKTYTMLFVSEPANPSFYGKAYEEKRLHNVPALYHLKNGLHRIDPDIGANPDIYHELVLRPEEFKAKNGEYNTGRGIKIDVGILLEGEYLPKENYTQYKMNSHPFGMQPGQFYKYPNGDIAVNLKLTPQEIQNIKNIGADEFIDFYEKGLDRGGRDGKPKRVGAQEIDFDALFPSLQPLKEKGKNSPKQEAPKSSKSADVPKKKPLKTNFSPDNSADKKPPSSDADKDNTKPQQTPNTPTSEETPDNTGKWAALVGGTALAGAGLMMKPEQKGSAEDKQKSEGWGFAKIATVAVGVTLAGWAAYKFISQGKGNGISR